MYSVKPNGNYNVVISDINFSVSATSDGALLTDAQVKASADVHRLVTAGYLILTKIDESTETTSSKTETTGPVPTAFVSHDSGSNPVPDGSFVAHQENLGFNNTIEAEETAARLVDPIEVVEFKQEVVKPEEKVTTKTADETTSKVTKEKTSSSSKKTTTKDSKKTNTKANSKSTTKSEKAK